MDNIIEDIAVAQPDTSSEAQQNAEEVEYARLLAYLDESFKRARDKRRFDEERWLKAYRNYRGIYGPDVQFTDAEKSRVFVKITKTKVLAAYGQVTEVLFANNKFPISVEPSRLPEGVEETVHIDPQAPQEEDQFGGDIQDVYGFPGDGRDTQPGATRETLLNRLGPYEEELKDLPVESGPGQTPTAIEFHPALTAAKKMEKKIRDQLDESYASKHLRHVAFEMALFGTGIVKGPFLEEKEYPRWEFDEETNESYYDPIIKTVPKIECVSIWNIYPDADAKSIEEADGIFQRHKLNRRQMRQLKNRPHFRDEVIERIIDDSENYTKEWWEDTLEDATHDHDVRRFEVMEYWGTIDQEIAEESGLDIPPELRDAEQLNVNIWYCGGRIIRLIYNPFVPERLPYMICPYEINPYSIFGVGLAENMEDTQTLMNGFMRMAVDNAALSGNVVFEVDETNLVPGQDFSIYPGKVFRREGGSPGQTLFSHKFQNTSQENMFLFDRARQLSDESTGIPSYSHGQTGVHGMTRTASGMSMLMGAASGNIKTIVKNIDDYLLRPLGESLFSFNMQFDPDPEIKGDLAVKARGTESLMQNEVRSQRLLTMLQVAANPAIAPYIKFDYIVRELASTLELDPDKLTNNPAEAARQALLMQQQGAQPAPEGAAPAVGADPMDMTGGGGSNIGVGGAPMPFEDQFSASE